jgi:hypothetical protein
LRPTFDLDQARSKRLNNNATHIQPPSANLATSISVRDDRIALWLMLKQRTPVRVEGQ